MRLEGKEGSPYAWFISLFSYIIWGCVGGNHILLSKATLRGAHLTAIKDFLEVLRKAGTLCFLGRARTRSVTRSQGAGGSSPSACACAPGQTGSAPAPP